MPKKKTAPEKPAEHNQQAQEVFDRIQETKKKMKHIKMVLKDALDSNGEYAEIQEKMRTLTENKRRVELAVKQGFSSELDKLSDLKIDLESDKEMLNDIALSSMMKGKTVEVYDSYKQLYLPIFKAEFKRDSI